MAALNINNQPLYRSRFRTTIYGDRLALDDDGMLVGPPALKAGLTSLGSTASQVPAHGVTILNAAAASTYIIDPPMLGIEKIFQQSSNGTSHNLITGTSNIKIISTFGSSQQRVCLQSSGDYVRLLGMSTAQWAVVGLTAGVSITT
jgi:hypothetical protein